MYETDYIRLEDDDALLYSTSPNTKVKHIRKKERLQQEKEEKSSKISLIPKTKEQELNETRKSVFGPSISTRSVPTKCNKCGHIIYGILVSVIFSAGPNIMTPFISYKCDGCGKEGYRSVKEKALPPDEFEKHYF